MASARRAAPNPPIGGGDSPPFPHQVYHPIVSLLVHVNIIVWNVLYLFVVGKINQIQNVFVHSRRRVKPCRLETDGTVGYHKTALYFLRFPPANISKCLLSVIAHACLVKIPRGCRMVFVRAL